MKIYFIMFHYSDKVNHGTEASQSHSKKASHSHGKKTLSQQKKEWWHAVIKQFKPICHGAVQTTT
jgi:hypothetical protein